MNPLQARIRITPAGAGKTGRRYTCSRSAEDHPRRCGENGRRAGAATAKGGSPPQVRGKRLCSQTPTVGNRITPAGAGKTNKAANDAAIVKDHPRRCGENVADKSHGDACVGSPPQVRGKQTYIWCRFFRNRITPAGAGKTIGDARHSDLWQDHPRRCGENSFRADRSRRRRGSPPQVRGKPGSGSNVRSTFRITPAGAGKTHGVCDRRGSRQDHPRRCGENLRLRALRRRRTGSPPQVRGKPMPDGVTIFLIRITPAGAGKT